MATVEMEMQARPGEVFRVLANGWLYAHWVVGTRRVHNVDRSFPRPGARFEPEVGPRHFSTRNWTTCIAVNAPRRIVLHAAAWPGGVAHVSILLRELSPGRTRVTVEEVPLRGPVLMLGLPGLRQLVRLRNLEGLSRLREIVERSDPHATACFQPQPA